MPGEALHLVSETMYDLIICDAKLSYKGAVFGGLILAEELAIRCGINAILVISQVVDDEYVRNYNSVLSFLKKPEINKTENWFENDLPKKMKTLIRRQYGFVAMPFGDKQLDTLYRKYIQKGIENAGFAVRRIDEIPFTKSITVKIFQVIRDAHFVILITSKLNPNVFYEGGYALALEKHIITCAPRISHLPFNIRDHRCIVYQGSQKEFSQQITDLIMRIRYPYI